MADPARHEPGDDAHTRCTELITYLDALEVLSTTGAQCPLTGEHLFALFHTAQEKAQLTLSAIEAGH